MSTFDDLWCEDCGKSHEGMCKKHGILHTVQDAVIPSRAKLTLPSSLILKSVKENGEVYSGVFSKRTIPVRSRFGPVDAPVITRMKLETKAKKETTVWKKKNAMQKAMENSTHSGETSDLNQSACESHSPIIPNRNLHSKGSNSVGAEVAISSIQQQLMSITSQSINNQGLGDGGLLLLQPGLNQIPMQSSPVGNQANLNQLQQSLPDLPPISFPNTCTPGGLQLTQENLQTLAHHYHTTYGSDLSSVQQNINLPDFVTHPQIQHAIGTDQSASSLLIAPPLDHEGQPADDSGVMDSSHVNASDCTVTDGASDTELDDSLDQDMSFELKVVTGDGYVELLDVSDEDHSNWMIFVRPATNTKEQNLIAYQEDGQIYFVSLKPISTNTELKVWYCKDYAKSIHKGMLSPDNTRQVDDNKLQCLMCETKFSDNDEMETHLCISKVKGRRKGRPRKYVKPTKTWRAKLEKTRIKESQDVTDKKNVDPNTSDDASVTPVKRGRGRPRIRPLSVKNEISPKPEPVHIISVHQIQQQQQQLQQHQQQTTKLEQTSPTFEVQSTPTEHVITIEYDDDADNTPDETSFEKQDSVFEEKKLVITTDDKPKKKRGPKSTKSPTVCPHCNESFLAEASFYLHVYSHTGIKPFICDVPGCERGFLSKFKLERHKLIHTSPRHHKCMYCDKSFNRKDHLKNHMITHDPNKKIWKCEICGKEYSYSFSYRTHMAFHAADRDETLTCGICKKVCDTKEQLLFHLKVHTGARAAKNSNEKVHQCFECSKKFFTRKDVKRHMITHTKKKDFLCQFCPQRFGRKDHLTRHLRTTHTGDNNSTSPRSRRNTGDNSATPSPVKPKRERQVYAQIEPTMVPLQMTIPTMQPEEIQEQLISGVVVPSQGGNMTGSQATLLHNLQYAVSQIPGHHVAPRDIQIPAALYEAAAAAGAQQQQQQEQQQQQQHQVQQNEIAAASLNNLQQTAGLPSIHTSLPVQYQIEKGYLLNAAPQQEATVVRQIQVSPNVDCKQFTQHINGNMYIAVSNASSLQHQNTHSQQVQQIYVQQQPQQQQQHQPQQQQQPQHQQQSLIPAGKLEHQAIELTRANGLAAVTGLQQPPEYQVAMAQSSVAPSVASSTDQKTPVLMASSVDTRQNSHSQPYSTILGYMETLRFLDHLPTNNTNAIPLQQLQTLNVDLSQGQQTQLIPAAAYNTVSSGNILNINQADLAKGVVTIQHPHGTLTSQDIKNVVTLAQTVAPVQHVTYQP